MDNSAPRLQSITGVARALITTLGLEEAVTVMVAQFGWDVAFQALAQLNGEDVGRALWTALQAGTD
jgi:hypothetical protein